MSTDINNDMLYYILKTVFPSGNYIDKKGVDKGFEIAIRQNGKGIYKKMYNILPQMGNASGSGEASGTVINRAWSLFQSDRKISQILSATVKNNALLNSISGDISSVLNGIDSLTALSWVNLGLTAINTGATVAGFAMLNKKINRMQQGIDEIRAQVEDARQEIKEIKDLSLITNIEERYGRLLNTTKRLTVNIEIGKEVKHLDLEDLIEDYRAFLSSITSFVLKHPSEPLLDIIYSLQPLFANLIILYYERFFEVYGEMLHPNHVTWIDVFEKIGGREFSDMLIDFYTIEKGFHHKAVNDVISANFLMVCDKEQKITDVINIMQVALTHEKYQAIMEAIDFYTYNQAKAEFESIKATQHISDEAWKQAAEQVWGAIA